MLLGETGDGVEELESRMTGERRRRTRGRKRRRRKGRAYIRSMCLLVCLKVSSNN